MNKNPFIIVVGLDYSEHSDGALTRAFELASREAAAEVHVISVLLPISVEPLHIPADIMADAEAASRQLRAHVEAKLHEFARTVDGREAKIPARVASHVRFDQPARGIAQLASDLEADLVVVGTHGRRGLSRLLLGSVAEEVLRLAPCPVLVMRPKSQPEGPAIEPPCPRCVEARQAAEGGQLWCLQHREKHGRRHTYHQCDRAGVETNFPLVTS